MRELLVLRHAKSDWSADHSSDHERPLNRRGVKAARLMGRFLSRAARLPDRVISSSAARALATTQLLLEAAAWPGEPAIEPRLYEASVDRVLEVVSELADDDAERLLIVGHEPTSSQLVKQLTGATVAFPTAALAAVGLEIESWSECRAARGTLLWLVVPKLLGEIDAGR